MAHTPGPWMLIPEGDGKYILKGADDTYAGIILLAMTEEDVRLVALAPVMYQALKEVMDLLPLGEARLRVYKVLAEVNVKNSSGFPA